MAKQTAYQAWETRGKKKDVAIYFSMINLQSCIYVPLNPKASSLGRTGIW